MGGILKQPSHETLSLSLTARAENNVAASVSPRRSRGFQPTDPRCEKKLGQKEVSDNYHELFWSTRCTVTLAMCDLASPHVARAVFSSFSGSRHASISTGSDYMNLNWPQFNTSVESRWLLPLKRRLAKTPAGWAATEGSPRRNSSLEPLPCQFGRTTQSPGARGAESVRSVSRARNPFSPSKDDRDQ